MINPDIEIESYYDEPFTSPDRADELEIIGEESLAEFRNNEGSLRSLLRNQTQLVRTTIIEALEHMDCPINVPKALEELTNELNPTNAMEEMLVSQIIVSHLLFMQSCANAALNRMCERTDKESRISARFQKSFMNAFQQLQKIRKPNSKQTIRVEHVNISGGQNIIGTVRGGGDE